MPHLDQWFPYKKLVSYPDMRPEDKRIWESFIEQFPNAFEKVMYDVRVGEEVEMLEVPRNVGEAWQDLTKWAIDVLGVKDNITYIIEIKPNANAKAIGQALCYAHLYRKEHPDAGRIIPTVLTDDCSPTTGICCQMLHVLLLGIK